MNQEPTDQLPPTQGTQSNLATKVIEEVHGLRRILGLVFKLGLLCAGLLTVAIGGTILSWRTGIAAEEAAKSADEAASTNTELLRIIKPLVTPTNLDAAKKRQACLVLLAADKPVDEGCAKIRDELVRIQAGGQ